VFDEDDRDLCQPGGARRLEDPVAVNDCSVRTNKDWLADAESFDAGANPRDLAFRFGVRPPSGEPMTALRGYLSVDMAASSSRFRNALSEKEEATTQPTAEAPAGDSPTGPRVEGRALELRASNAIPCFSCTAR
jgi:hypothetical protein